MKSRVSNQAAQPELLESVATQKALEEFRDSPHVTKLVWLVDCKLDDLMAWIDANYVRKEPQA